MTGKKKEKVKLPKGSDEHGKTLDLPAPKPDPPPATPPSTPPATAPKPSTSSETEKSGSKTTTVTRKPRHTSSKKPKPRSFINGIVWD